MALSIVDGLADAARQVGGAFGQAFRSGQSQVAASTPQIHVDMRGGKSGGLVAMTCPKCNASIQAPAGQNTCYCTYCGSQLLLDDGSATVTYRTVDETKIRELEAKSALEMKRLEIEEKRRPGRIKATIVLAIIGALMLLGGYILGDASGDSNSSWYMVASCGFLPLFAIVFIWFRGKQSGDD